MTEIINYEKYSGGKGKKSTVQSQQQKIPMSPFGENRQLPIVNGELSMNVGYWPWTIDRRLLTVDCRPLRVV
jgi:hypothetical protein